MSAVDPIRRFVTALFRYPPLAHHPTCRCYDAHVLRIGSWVVCLGCSCLVAGLLLVTLVLTWATQHAQSSLVAIGPATFFLVGIGLYLPTTLQPFVRHRTYKIVARFLLGASIPCLWFGPIVLLPWTVIGIGWRAAFVVFFVVLFWGTSRLRQNFTPRPCDACPHGRFPLCTDNRPRVERLLLQLRREASPEDVERITRFVEEGNVAALAAMK